MYLALNEKDQSYRAQNPSRAFRNGWGRSQAGLHGLRGPGPRPPDAAQLRGDAWEGIRGVYIKALGFMKIRHTPLEIIYETLNGKLAFPGKTISLIIVSSRPVWAEIRNRLLNSGIRAPFLYFLAEDGHRRSLHIHDPALPVCHTKALRRILGPGDAIWGRGGTGRLHRRGGNPTAWPR